MGRGHEESTVPVTDALGNAGCTGASMRGHSEGMELLFERYANSFDTAVSSAVSDIERAGYRVFRIEVEREATRRWFLPNH